MDLAIPALGDLWWSRSAAVRMGMFHGREEWNVDDSRTPRMLWGGQGVNMVKHLLALKLSRSPRASDWLSRMGPGSYYHSKNSKSCEVDLVTVQY